MNNKSGIRKTWRMYAIRILLFLLLLGTADFITGSLFSYLYRKQRGGDEFTTLNAAEKVKADLLIMGASRAMQQINPQYIEDSLNLSAWNIGRDGMPFFYSYGVLQMILRRYTPKVIILDCEYKMLMEVPAHYDRLSVLLPFYRNHPEVRHLINKRGPFERYKHLSAVYPYNSMVFKLLKANFSAPDSSIKGYEPLYRALNEPTKTWDYGKPYTLDSNKVSMFRAFIDSCKNRNIQLVFLSPPYYFKTIGTDRSFAMIHQIAEEKKIPFIDYTTDSFYFNRPYLFDDTVHLNRRGSDIFSPRLAGDLKKLLN